MHVHGGLGLESHSGVVSKITALRNKPSGDHGVMKKASRYHPRNGEQKALEDTAGASM
jgi:hypothetical protein